MAKEAPPLSFRVDVNGDVLEALEKEGTDFCLGVYAGNTHTAVGMQIQNHAEAFCACDDSRNIARQGAFVVAAHCAVEAFKQGSLEQEYRERSLKQFVLSQVPPDILLGDLPLERSLAFQRHAGEAFTRHPEAQQIGVALVRQRHRASDPVVVEEAALAGFGYVLDRLDTAWGRVRPCVVEQIARDEFETVKDVLEKYSW